MKCKDCGRDIPDNSIFCNWCGCKQLKQSRDSVKVPAPQLRNGSYWGRVTAPNGARISVTETTEAKYYAAARAIKTGKTDIKKAAPGQNLGTVVKSYIDKNESVLSPSTVRGYIYACKRLEKWDRIDVARMDWQGLINDLSAKYEPKTVRNTWGLITAALTFADKDIPTVHLPAKKKAERNFLDYEQIKTYLDKVHGRPIELVSLLALHGLRQSEIMALKCDSVRDGVIRVRGAVVMDKNNDLVRKNTNKNITSSRDVPVMIPRLLEIWDTESDPIFPHPSNIRDDILRICKEADLPPCSCHNLRHSMISLAHHLGWDTMTTQRIGGYSGPETVNAVYTHLSLLDRNADIEAMKDFYKRNKNGTDFENLTGS